MRNVESKSFVLLLAVVLSLLLAACGDALEESPSTPTPILPLNTPEAEPASSAEDEEKIVATRAPEPTATPDRIAQEVTEFVESTRLRGTTFFWA